MNLNYLLTGIVSGDYLEIHGSGTIDQSSGQTSFDLDVPFGSKSWDPAFIVSMCCDSIRFLSAQIPEGSSLLKLRCQLRSLRFGSAGNINRSGSYRDDEGKEVVTVQARGFVFVEKDAVYSRTVVREASSQIYERGGVEGLITPYEERVLPTGPFTAAGISAYKVKCRDGSTLSGSTYYPYEFESAVALPEITLSVEHVQIHATGESSAHVEMRVRCSE